MSELLDEIQKRITDPHHYVSMTEGDGPTLQLDRARAVAALFQTADPEASSKLKRLDIGAELLDAARELRERAEDQVRVADCIDYHEQIRERALVRSHRLGFLANVVQETESIIRSPARMLQILMRDRDTWQQLQQQQAEMLGLTEAALGVSQAANLELVEGQSKLIGLLERVARADANWLDERTTPMPETDGVILETVRRWRRPNGEACPSIADIMPEIHATLNQVTAIETSAEGRLQVAQQPIQPAQE